MANRKKRIERERASCTREAAFRTRLREGKRRHSPVRRITRVQRELLFAARFQETHLPKAYWNSPLASLCRSLGELLRRPLGFHRGIYADGLALADDLLRHPRMHLLLFRESYRDQIIWALRAGAVVRRVADWQAPRTRDPQVMLRSFLLHVMAAYPGELPPSVKNSIPGYAAEIKLHYCSRRKDWFATQDWVNLNLHLAKGENIRRHASQQQLPRKTHYFLLRAPRRLPLYAAIQYAIFRSFGIAPALSKKMTGFLSCSYNLDEYRELLQFIARCPSLTPEEVEAICEFYEHQVRGELVLDEQSIKAMYSSFTFKGRTQQSVLRIIREWEAYIQAQLRELHVEPYPEPAISEYEEGEFTIRRLRNRAELIEEGWQMQHCVATYHQACLEGTTIWSVSRQVPDRPSPKRMATIEVLKGRVWEFQGKCNTMPGTKTKQVVKRWMKREGLVWS